MKNELIYYLGLTAIVFIAHHFSGFLEKIVVSGNKLGWLYLFIWYTLFLWCGDKLLTRYLK